MVRDSFESVPSIRESLGHLDYVQTNVHGAKKGKEKGTRVYRKSLWDNHLAGVRYARRRNAPESERTLILRSIRAAFWDYFERAA